MFRERASKVVLLIVGLIFVATAYGVLVLRDESLQMMLSIYATLGVFLLFAVRNPSAHRSLIGFTAWSSFVHASVMAVQSAYDVGERMHLVIGSRVCNHRRRAPCGHAAKTKVSSLLIADHSIGSPTDRPFGLGVPLQAGCTILPGD